MLVSRSSLAYWTVTALRNVFDGAYAAEIGPVSAPGVVCRVREPTPLDMFTIRGDAERRSSGSIALVTRMTPITLVSTTVRMVEGSTRVGSCGMPPVTPALLTSTSRRPARSSTSSAAAATPASSVTSRGTPNAAGPAARSFSTAASRRSSSRPPTPTVQPRAPRPAAISYPIPLFAPVTSAIVCSLMHLILSAPRRRLQHRLGNRRYLTGIGAGSPASSAPRAPLRRRLSAARRGPSRRVPWRHGDAGAAVFRRRRRGAALRAGRAATRDRAAAAVAGDPAARTAARGDAAGTQQPRRHADRGRV